MNKKSGMLGISGVSSDFRDLGDAAKQGNKRAALALETFAYKVKKYIGAYAAAMNGVDCIVFTAGVGENDRAMRAAIMKDMEYLGVAFDEEYNMNCPRGSEQVISKPESSVKVIVIPTDEEMMIAKDTAAIVRA
jgi:acetate kinase